MRCRFCGCSNTEDEHRCQHCGRRLDNAAYPVAQTAAAPALAPAEGEPAEAPAPGRQGRTGPRQGALFGGQKVIPFEVLAPDRVPSHRRQGLPRRERTAPRIEAQQALPLRTPSTAAQPDICDDAPVALAGVRFRAALQDGAVFAVCLGLFATTFHFLGGRFAFQARSACFYLGAVAALFVWYRLFWCILGRESAGMRWNRLRLVTFDGAPASWQARTARFIAASLGAASLGLGLVWCLMDEEGLSWHDHITKTYPTEKLVSS